jgi:NAD(P)-dependent dehydrogenase (short-subunit alcohol dehydrogenase family)
MSALSDIPPALVTGASHRIGRAIALAIARSGRPVGVHYASSREGAEGVVAEIEKTGVRAVALQADLRHTAAPRALVEECALKLGQAPGVLVNNASLFEPDEIDTLSEETWAPHIAINLTAPVLLAQAFAERLPQAAQGTIVNILDQRVLRPQPGFFSYSLSKSALWSATQLLAQALAPRIRVNGIGPGPVMRSIHQTEQDFAAEVRSTLLTRQPQPEDIARAVLFIIDQPAMTGQMIAIDSGQHLIWQGAVS